MSTKTTNLEMTLLAEEDNFDTNVYNENFQKTDDKIGELNSMLGSEELTTTSQTHSGAINELNKNKITVQEKDQIHFVNDLVLPMSSKTNSLPIYKMHMEWHSSDGWCMIIYYYYNGEYHKGRIKLTETAKI